MNGDMMQGFGVTGLLAVMIVKELFAFLKARETAQQSQVDSSDCSGCSLDERAVAKIHNVHDLLGAVDEDGAPRVYTPRTMQRTLQMIADTQRQQTEILSRLADHVEAIKGAR